MTMAPGENIDNILRDWNYEPETLSVRMVQGDDDRALIQMRVDLGVLQIDTTGRPDGTEPEGFQTYLEYVLWVAAEEDSNWVLDEEQCMEIDREFVQFYHRRICWLKLQRFDEAVEDADHTLQLMDFCQKHSPDEAWTLTHEQYRPFVVFHRTQAAAFARLQESDAEDAPELAIAELNQGLDVIRDLYENFEVAEDSEDDELVRRLVELRDSLCEKHEVLGIEGLTLEQQLNRAVENEEYELAAEIRDKLAKREDS